MSETVGTQQAKRENPFINIIANIALPVFILNKSSYFPGDNKSLMALGVALSFPIAYGLWDLFKNSRTNYFSILGLVNTLITGMFAVYKLGGGWFAIKEAAFPAILGVAVLASSYIKKPFLKTLLFSSGMLKTEEIKKAAQEKNNETALDKVFMKSNTLFSFSFFVSAALNFVLAIYIFAPLEAHLNDEEKSIALNSQISQMTWMGFLVIGIPMFAFLGATFYILFKDLKRVTGLSEDEMLSLN